MAERLDLIPFVPIALGEGGLPRCERCIPEATSMTPRESADIRKEIEDAASGWNSLPGPNLVLGGAEAFAHPDLPALVVCAAEAGVVRIALETGGGPLAVGENAAGALHVGVRHLTVHYVPLDHVDTGPAAFPASRSDAALAGIRAFIRAAENRGEKVAVSAVVPVCRHTAPRLPAAIAELAEAGAGVVRLVAGDGSSCGPTAIDHVTAGCDTGVVNGVWVEVSGITLPESHRAHAVAGDSR